MALNLMNLLQAAAGVTPEDDDNTTPQDIVVQATRPVQKFQKSKAVNFPDAPSRPPLSNGPDAPDFGNRSYAEAAQAALQNDAGIHKGMFGTKGTLRNILGLVGDAFLVQAGKHPIYAAKREQERQQDALSGFTDNPMAALERLAQANPDAAQSMYGSVGQLQNAAAANAARASRYQQQAQNEADAKYQQYARLFSQYMGGATPETYSKIKPLLQTLVKRGGLGNEFNIPDQFDPELAKSYQTGGMTASQQVVSDQRASHNAATERAADINARAHMINATRPPAARSAPQPTAASIAAPLLKKIENGEKLTPGQEEVLRRTGYYPNRGQGKDKQFSLPPLPPGFKLK